MLKLLSWALPPILLFACGFARADEASVRDGIESFLGAKMVDTVARVPYGDLYEVVLKSGEVVYTDEKIGFIIDGQIIDTKSRRNVTQAKLNELSRIDFSTLPLDQAIKLVKGNGKRVMATFEDPNCGYCKRLAKELTSLKDVTIYTFLIPILSADSDEKARRIWCARDRAASWNNWMLNGKAPAEADCDSSTIERNAEFAHKLRVNGTPTLFFADGSRVPGFLRAADIEKALSSAPAKN